MKIDVLALMMIIIFRLSVSYSQKQILYKQIDTTNLFMYVFNPENLDVSKEYPAIVFFFGGGWINGSPVQFEPHAQYFSKRGMICFLVEYRVESRNNTTPFESLKDAKSAIRYIRGNPDELHVDTSRIVAAGGSAGGHLAAATAFIEGYNENTDNQTISCIPNALILFNPVIDNGPGGYGYERIGDDYKNFSPLHNTRKGAPPTILFLGTNDNLIPVETVKYYQKVMEKLGDRCDLHLYNKQGHGFFNYKNFKYYKKTLAEADKFLQSLGYLTKELKIRIE